MASSTPRRFIFSFMCFRKARAEISSAFTALYAVRRKFTTETPGTSTGYCMARNRPRWARWSGRRARMFSPLNRTSPAVTWYPGRPISTFASVDFPLPFGPISAWVSPWRTVRSMPFRISLPSTVAWRPRISSSTVVAGASFVAVVVMSVVHLDQDVVAVDLHRVRPHGLRGRQGARPTGLEVEGRAVLRALDGLHVGVHLALVQVRLRVRADGSERPELAAAEVRHGHLGAVVGEPPGLALRDLVRGRDLHQRHQSSCCSSRSIACSRPRRTSGRSTRSRTSWKNPNTMSRSASFLGIPRLCR